MAPEGTQTKAPEPPRLQVEAGSLPLFPLCSEITMYKSCSGRSMMHEYKTHKLITDGVAALLRCLGDMPAVETVDISNNGLFGVRWEK